MAQEKLQIEISARDQASGAIRGVATKAKAEFRGMGDTAKATGRVVEGQMKGVAKATKGVGTAAKITATQTKGAFRSMGIAAKQYQAEIRMASMAMVGVGVATIAVATKCIGALAEEERAQAKLTSAIKGSAQAIDQMALEKLASDLQKVTIFGNEATIEMMAILTTFDLTQQEIEQLAPRIQNISAILGTDLVSSAVAVGKAIQLQSASALRRYGIIIDDATMASGDFVGMLKAIDANTGPAAEVMAKGTGAFIVFRNAVGDLEKAIAKGLLPTIKAVLPYMQGLAEAATKLAEMPGGQLLIKGGVATGLGIGALGLGGLVGPPVARGVRGVAQAAGWVRGARGVAAAAPGAAPAVARGGAGLARLAAPLAVIGSVAEPTSAGIQAWRGAPAGTSFAGRLWASYRASLAATPMGMWTKLFGRREGEAAQGIAEAVAPVAEVPAAVAAAPMIEAAPVAPPPHEFALTPESAALAEVAAEKASLRTVAGMAELGGGAWAMPAARAAARLGGGAISLRAAGVEVSDRDLPDGGREIVIRVLLPHYLAPGGIDDQMTGYLEDLQYAEAPI